MGNGFVLALTVAAGLGSGMVAGFFFAFSICVMRALGRLRPDLGIAAMQSINAVVLNRWFFTAFFGTAAVCLVLGISAIANWGEPGAVCVLAGSLFYLGGSIFVTIAFNVPLNDALAAVQPDSAEDAELWARYVAGWTAWNHVRAAASLAAAALFTVAGHMQA
jgi:uncharacterized membrane protein